MWLQQLWRRWMGSIARKPLRKLPRRRTRTACVLEVLEDRTLLNNYFASSPSQLISDIHLANGDGQVDTITLQSGTTFTFTSPSNGTDGGNALPQVTGNITIAGNNDTLQASISNPGLVTLFGGGFRLFDVASGGSLTLQNLTLAGGVVGGPFTTAKGGAIYSSGTLTLSSVTVQNNEAVGGIGNSGSDASNGSLFTGFAAAHSAASGSGGGNAYGGGLYVAGGTVTLNDAIFNSNVAQGGAGGGGGAATFFHEGTGGHGGNGGAGQGGGLYVAGGTVTLSGGIYESNKAAGGTGGAGGVNAYLLHPAGTAGDGGAAAGGALYLAGGTATPSSVTFLSNHAQGGTGGAGPYGGKQGGHAGNGGNAAGGSLYLAGSAALSANGFYDNQAKGGDGGVPYATDYNDGGDGGSGGNALGGSLYVASGTVTLSGDTMSTNEAKGGNGQDGGSHLGAAGHGGNAGGGGWAFGGGLYVYGGTVTVSNESITGNSARAGNGGHAGAEAGASNVLDYNLHLLETPFGIAADIGDYIVSQLVQLAFGSTNSALASGNGGSAYGGGLFVFGGTVTLNNDTLSSNVAVGGNGGLGGIPGGSGGLLNPAQGGNGGYGGDGAGGGLYVYGGNVTLNGGTINSNQVQGAIGGAGGSSQWSDAVGSAGSNGNAAGGGVYVYERDNPGTVNLNNVTIDDNTALGGMRHSSSASDGHLGNGGAATGGGLFVAGGTVQLTSDTIQGNQAVGGASWEYSGGNAEGGGLYVFVGYGSTPLVVQGSDTTISNNSVTAGKSVAVVFGSQVYQHGSDGTAVYADIAANVTDLGIYNATTTTLTSSSPNNTSTYGDSVTFTATVTSLSNSGTPTGSVEFFDGSTDLGAGAASTGGSNSAAWTFTTSTLTAGSHTIKARYHPSGSFPSSSATVTQVVRQAPLVVQSVQVNDGSVQRSMVTSLTVTLNQPISSLGTCAFEIDIGTTQLCPTDLTVSGNQAVIRFTGLPGVTAGSLADGRYTLVEHLTLIQTSNPNYVGQGDHRDAFFRLLGDATGDGKVDATDRTLFLVAYRSRRGMPNYRWYFDVNNDGFVDSTDYYQFQQRYGTSLPS
jgi:hypothetical protein